MNIANIELFSNKIQTASKKSIEIIGEISLICKWITAFFKKNGLLMLNP